MKGCFKSHSRWTERVKKKESGTCLRRNGPARACGPAGLHGPDSQFQLESCSPGTKTWGDFFFFLVDWQLLLWLKTGILSVLHRGSLICSNSNVWFSFPPYKPFFLASASKMLSMRRIFLCIKVICSWAKTGWCIFRGIKGKTAERTHSSATLQFCSKIWHKSTLS